MHGETGVGKTYIACAFAQEAGYPYSVFDIQVTSLFTKWHNSAYEGMKYVLNEAVKYAHASGKKTIVILENIEEIENNGGYFSDQLGSLALHEFFDKQDAQDIASRDVSVIGITDDPKEVSSRLLAKFFQKIQIEQPDVHQRQAIILSCIGKLKDRIDECVIQKVNMLADMSASLTPRRIEDMFSWAD